MPVLSEDWSKREYNESPDGRWTARIEYLVAPGFRGEYLDETIALSVAPQQGSGHPLNPYLLATAPQARREGLNLWRVVINYAIVPSINGSLTGNPLNAPLRIRWERGEQTVAVDTDTLGNPLVNSAGDSFDPSPTRIFPSRFFTLTRNEPTFNFSQAVQYEACANSSPWTIFGVTFDVGTVMCHSIVPAEEYADNALYLPISYKFEINASGFQLRVLDQGKRAYYAVGSANALGLIFDKAGNATTSDALLNGSGGLAPLAAAQGLTVSGNTATNGGMLPSGAIIDTVTPYKAGTIWLKFGSFTPMADFNLLAFT